MRSSLTRAMRALKGRRLSVRLLLAVGGCSLLFVLLAIGWQLATEYRRDLEGIDSRLRFIADSYVPALSASAYQLDEEQVRLQLRGILQLADIVYVQVQEQLNQQTYAIAEGDAGAGAAVVREFPLRYPGSPPILVGTLLVKASLDGATARLRQRALTITVTNALLIVPLALAILIILQLALNRHLVKMAQYAREFSLDTLDQDLVLQRRSGRGGAPDELDQLVASINEMRLRIRDDLEHRREAQRQLLLQKVLLESVIEARIDGILIVGQDRRCLLLNRHFATLWHLPPELAAGAAVTDVVAWIKQRLQDPESFEGMIARLEEAPDQTLQGETLLRTGEVYEYASVPVTNSAGLQYGRLWSCRDITQRKALEEQLRQARKLETLGSLAGGIAHDLNNLLSPIIGYAELGLIRATTGDGSRANFSQIVKAAGRAADLTRQILAFSRKQVLAVKIIDLNQLLHDLATMMQRLIGETVVVQILPVGESALVRADKGQIEQVILNMAINGRDAMPAGGTLTLETAFVDLDQNYAQGHPEVEPGEYVMLSISDTGEGIDPLIRDRIFEPFFTTKEHGKGTGLGLATSFGIIKQHHGHIWVYSELGHGTIFKIYLPRAQGTPQPAPAEEPVETTLHGSEHILVVEDDPMVRELVCTTLVSHGYRITAADSPAAAVDRVNQGGQAIDLLLTDVVMPGMNGRQLHRRLALAIADLKVLYMSGYTENVIADQGVLYAGVDFIQKPFSVHALLSKVRQVLD